MRNKKALIDAISNFALDSRRLFYSRRPACQSKVVENVQEKFNRLCEVLDFGLLAQLDNDVVKKQEHQQKYMSIVDELSSGSFPYFMYGTVHWERKRKTELSLPLLTYLMKDDIFTHDCVTCFNDASIYCDHPCCQAESP